MKSARLHSIFAALVLVGAPAAHALPTLVAGPASISHDVGAGNRLACSVVNVGAKDVEVTVTALLDDTSATGPSVLAPGDFVVAFNENSAGFPFTGHCEVEVKGGKKNVRASLCALDQDGNCRAALPAQ